jgi:phytoene desaturase
MDDEKIMSKDYSCSTFMLYLGVKKEFRDIPHHSIIFAKDYKRNINEITEEKFYQRIFHSMCRTPL